MYKIIVFTAIPENPPFLSPFLTELAECSELSSAISNASYVAENDSVKFYGINTYSGNEVWL